MLLQVENNLDKQQSTQFSNLSSAISAGGTVFPVKNVNGFNQNWAFQLGKTMEGQAEILTNPNNPSGGTALNSQGTNLYSHPIDTPVFQIHYDKVIFLRSTTGTSGTASAIATVSITPNQFYTEYNDASGALTYAYQSQFYNSVSGDTSGTSSWFIPGGPTFYSLQKLRSRLKHDLYSANYIKDDNTIIDWVNEWLEIMTNSMIKVNQGYALGTASYPFSLSGTPSLALGTVTDPLFKNPIKVEITYDGVNYVNSMEIPYRSFGMNDNFSAIYPRHFWMGDTVFGILPPGTGGTVRMSNSIRYNPLVNDTDELPQILKGYTIGCIEYGLYKAYSLDQKDDIADRHFQKFVMYQNAFISEITPRDMTGEKMINLSESISGMNEDVVLSTEYFL